MKKLAPLVLTAALTACAAGLERGEERLGVAQLMHANGQPVGDATLVASGDKLRLDVALTGVPAGTRGFHLHTTGQCAPPDFQSAGGHLNPSARQHGSANPAGAHLGDLPNLRIEPTGTTRASFPLTGSRSEILTSIFDADGTAVMIHAQQDDYRTDPTGNAGARIVCGVLQPLA